MPNTLSYVQINNENHKMQEDIDCCMLTLMRFIRISTDRYLKLKDKICLDNELKSAY